MNGEPLRTGEALLDVARAAAPVDSDDADTRFWESLRAYVVAAPLDDALGRAPSGHRASSGPPVAPALVTAMTAEPAPIVLAVGGPASRQVSALAVPLARARDAAVHVLDVSETNVRAGVDTADLRPRQAHGRCSTRVSPSWARRASEVLRGYGTMPTSPRPSSHELPTSVPA
jgi:hypothetical protein